MKEFTVTYILTDEQVENLCALKAKLDAAEALHSDSVEDLFAFMMNWGCAADISNRASLLSEMAENTPRKKVRS